MAKTIFLATIVAVTILGLATSSIALNYTAEAIHGGGKIDPCPVFQIFDPASGECLNDPDDCPNGLAFDGFVHCASLSKAQQKAVDKANKTIDKACEKITKEITKLNTKGQTIPIEIVALQLRACEPIIVP